MASSDVSDEFAGSVWSDLRRSAFSYGHMDVGGISTRYISAGPEDAPAMLFLHGTGGHLEAFARNIAAHARYFRTWVIDMVGHGFSDLGRGSLEIMDYASHVLAFLDAAGIDRVALSGVSLGGWVASRIAVDHPERVSALGLITPGGSRANPAVMRTIREKTSEASNRQSWDAIRSRLEFLVLDPKTIHDDLVATRRSIYQREGMRETMERVLVLQDPEVRQRNLITPEEYGRISSPTLVVWTDHDPTAPPEEGERIAAMIPASSYVLMEGCAHWPQFEAPERFNELHISFLRTHLAAA